MSEFTDIIGQSKLTLVDFYATWCGPCKMQAPILEDVKNIVGDNANEVQLDVDKKQDLAGQYRVQSIPPLLAFRDGEPVWRVPGLHQADQLVAKINELLNVKDWDIDR